MDAVLHYSAQHWLSLTLLGLAGVLAILLARRAGGSPKQFGTFVFLTLLAFFALGGLNLLPTTFGHWFLWGGQSIIAGMLGLLFVTSLWAWPLALFAGILASFGLGLLVGDDLQNGLEHSARFLVSIRTISHIWLLGLLVLPFIWHASIRSLAGLGSFRRRIAIGLRCLVLLLIVLALAEAQGRRASDGVTVLFVWDRSLSMPRDMAGGEDQREKRIFRFINDAVVKRPPGRPNDQVGILVFGRDPHVDLSPGRINTLAYRKVLHPVDGTFTDIASAIRLARATFPENTGRRIVLVTDGKENLGKALKEAESAKSDGVQIDVVPIDSDTAPSPEVIVEFAEAPAVVEHNQKVPVRVRLRNLSGETVEGTVVLYKKSFEIDDAAPAKEPDKDDGWPRRMPVKLPPGVKEIYVQAPGLKKNEAYLFEAVFLPVIDQPDGKSVVNPRLAGDRPQNNRASAGVVARGGRAVLLIEATAGEHKLLARRLQHTESSLSVVAATAASLPKDSETFAFILNKFDGVILANVPADLINEDQQKVIRSAVHDQGIGLIMIGGHQSFGAGGWQGTEVEKALPVMADLKSLHIETKSGLVLIMHASEIAEGNAWQRKIAKLAVERLAPVDMMGMIYWDHGARNGHTWHIPFQQIGKNKGAMLGLIDNLNPGDMPEVDSAFWMAHKELTNKEYNLGTKHIILISDGDHWNAGLAPMQALRDAKITCTTICITSHGEGERKRMKTVSDFTGGRFHDVRDPKELPSIYIKETRLVSKAFVHEERFKPYFRKGEDKGPVETFNDADLVHFHGFVRTTRRPSPLVHVPIETPKIGEYHFPMLAHWQYGLGKAIAFTSDARSFPKGAEAPEGIAFWDKEWAGSGDYTRFWEQIVKWSLRTEESGKFLEIRTPQVEDGKVKVLVVARDKDGSPIMNVKFELGVTSPSFKEKREKKSSAEFKQERPGEYEVELPAEEVGTYFITARGTWKDSKGAVKTESVRGAVSIPYSPEYSQVQGETGLLDRVRDITGGNRYEDNAKQLEEIARSGVLFRPVPLTHQSHQPLWSWLVLLAGFALVSEVAVRRIAIDPNLVAEKLKLVWHKLRGQAIEDAAPAFLERLKAKKAEVSEGLERKQAARRFEGDAFGPDSKVPSATEPAGASEPRKTASTPQVSPEAETDPTDFASRLLRAKRKAMEERDKKKE